MLLIFPFARSNPRASATLDESQSPQKRAHKSTIDENDELQLSMEKAMALKNELQNDEAMSADGGQDRSSPLLRSKSRSNAYPDSNCLSADHHFIGNSILQGQGAELTPLLIPDSHAYIFNEDTEKYFNWSISNLIQFNNKNCLVNLFIGGTGIGIWWSILTISASTLQKFGFTELESAFICLIYILVGTFVAILIIHSLAKKEDLGIKISLSVVILVSTVFIIIGYYEDQSDGWKISDSLTMSIVVFLMFVLLGICMEILLGLLLNSCVIVTEPAHECVATGNVIALSGLVSFCMLEVIAEFPGFEFGVIVIIG